MTKFSSKLFLTALTLVALVSFTYSPVAEAARGGGGGGGGGGGANRASAGGGGGGGGNRPAPAAQQRNVQANNVNADKRTNNVRNTSANNVNVNNNNVNVNKNVNVNVDNNGGCCNNGWDNDHPVAKVAAVTATVAVTSAVIGSMVRTVPPGCAPVNYGGMVYQQCGGTWYQPSGSQYMVVNPPY